MQITNLTLSSPPTRASLWKMFNEAWGYLTGGIEIGDLSTTVKLLESQVAFWESGHNHNATTNAGGKPLVTTGLAKRHFNLQDLTCLWGNYYSPRIRGEYIYAVLAGSGSIPLASTTTGLVYGTVRFDYNPYDTTWATTQLCQLDLRMLSAYNSAAPFNSGWTVAFAYLTPRGTATITDFDYSMLNQGFGFDYGASSAPYFRVVAATTATGTLYFDYKVVLRRLA